MAFLVKNLRTNQQIEMTSKQLRDSIIKVTKSTFDPAKVTPERTGKRPTKIESVINGLDKHITVIKNVYIVTALYKYNPNVKSRYLLLIDGCVNEIEKNVLLRVIHDYVPIWCVKSKEKITDENAEYSFLSKWFRNTMGNGFSFIDIDYFMYNQKNSSVLLLEEKNTNIFSIPYGQLLSYDELLRDVILKQNAKLIFLFVQQQILFFTCNRHMLSQQNRKYYFTNVHSRFIIHRHRIRRAYNLKGFINYIHKL